ncbi:MAG TPA: hypothetical protein VLQ94_02065 [Candidatus Binatia bacterium]|nr:hypothetical protein [Candidatus Binatia bacterium]
MGLAAAHFAQERRRGFLAGFEIPARGFAREAISVRLARGENPVRW